MKQEDQKNVLNDTPIPNKLESPFEFGTTFKNLDVDSDVIKMAYAKPPNNLTSPFKPVKGLGWVPVDSWIIRDEDKIIKQVKDYLILPISEYYGIDDMTSDLDYFSLRIKRCYNSDKIRDHFVRYLNYFEKFYDKEKEMITYWARIKYLIDREESYDKNAFIQDINKYILNGMMKYKVRRMVYDNYSLHLGDSYTNTKNPELQYNDHHGLIFMEYSIFMNIVIPLITHFASAKKILDIKDLLLEVFSMIFSLHDEVDMYSKLYETAMSNINKSRDNHSVLWEMQAIRGENNTTHSQLVVENIILQIIPKYVFNENMIFYNYGSISTHIGYQVVDIGYEYSFVSLSSSKRDEDNNSEMDKFESHLTKTDMSVYAYYNTACKKAMEEIEAKYGPFLQNEIDFYAKELSTDGVFTINSFQKNLIFNLFCKYFGSPTCMDGINQTDYIKLIIAAKELLSSYGMKMLPAIISSKVIRIVPRKNINKKELIKLEASALYDKVKNKYRNEKIEKSILGYIAQILSSEFQFIDYTNEYNGMMIDVIPEYICDEMLMFVLLI